MRFLGRRLGLRRRIVRIDVSWARGRIRARRRAAADVRPMGLPLRPLTAPRTDCWRAPRRRAQPRRFAVHAVERRERGQAADRLGGDAADLRSFRDRAAGGEIVQQPGEILGRQVFVIVVVDLHHRRVAAGAETLDLAPREQAVRRDVIGLADALAQHGLDSSAPRSMHGVVPQSWT